MVVVGGAVVVGAAVVVVRSVVVVGRSVVVVVVRSAVVVVCSVVVVAWRRFVAMASVASPDCAQASIVTASTAMAHMRVARIVVPPIRRSGPPPWH